MGATSIRRSLVAVVAAVALLLASACGEDDDQGNGAVAELPPATGTTLAPVPPGDGPFLVDSEPPNIDVFGSTGELSLRPFTYCWTQDLGDGESVGTCADGAWPDPLPSAGTTNGIVTFLFPLEGWEFTATTGTEPDDVGRDATVTEVAAGKWSIELAGLLGTNVVALSGFGPEGDVHVVFTVDLLSGVESG